MIVNDKPIETFINEWRIALGLDPNTGERTNNLASDLFQPYTPLKIDKRNVGPLIRDQEIKSIIEERVRCNHASNDEYYENS